MSPGWAAPAVGYANLRSRPTRTRIPTTTDATFPLDDCLYALQVTVPHLTRSSRHRCLQRHGIGRLPQIEGDKPAKKAFKADPIGYFHVDIAEVQTAEGKLYLFVALDRTSKFAFTSSSTKPIASPHRPSSSP